jgi:DNA-directed RNA polymerase specialized sigma24 family protein
VGLHRVLGHLERGRDLYRELAVEIAATLEVSENSVKTHLKRGLARLRTVTDLADDDTEEHR